MIIDCISDLHGHYPELEGGDLLIVAGDLTAHERASEQLEFLSWMQNQKYTRKVFIAGNHDNWLTGLPHDKFSLFGVTYLCDSGVTVYYDDSPPLQMNQDVMDIRDCVRPALKSLKIWGSPWTLTFPGINPKCTAFTGDEKLLAEKFALIPDDIDILITHGPPKGVNDWNKYGDNCGSVSLLNKAGSLPNLKLFVFGHIHEAYGLLDVAKAWDNITPKEWLPAPRCKSFPKIVNCSHVNEHYEPVNKPIRIIL